MIKGGGGTEGRGKRGRKGNRAYKEGGDQGMR